MLIAISGSQGSGKTTILQQIEEMGFLCVARKTSRSILEDWDVTLQQVNNDDSLTTKFQDEITNRKFRDEQAAQEDDLLWFTERTHADLFTYALVTLGKNNGFDDWLNRYYETCMSNSQGYEHTFYLRAGHFVIVGDGTRGSNRHYSRMVDITMLDLTQQMIPSNRLTVIETPDLAQRVSLITTQAQTFWKEKHG